MRAPPLPEGMTFVQVFYASKPDVSDRFYTAEQMRAMWQAGREHGQSDTMAALPLPKSIVNAFVGKDRAAWEHGFHTGCRMMKEALPAPPTTSDGNQK